MVKKRLCDSQALFHTPGVATDTPVCGFLKFDQLKKFLGASLYIWLGQVKGEIWIDGVRLYEGKKQEREEFVPPKSVEAEGKLIATWAAIKATH